MYLCLSCQHLEENIANVDVVLVSTCHVCQEGHENSYKQIIPTIPSQEQCVESKSISIPAISPWVYRNTEIQSTWNIRFNITAGIFGAQLEGLKPDSLMMRMREYQRTVSYEEEENELNECNPLSRLCSFLLKNNL